MNSARRHVARSLLMLAALVVCGFAPTLPPAPEVPLAPPVAGRAAPDELARIRRESRLRKLHLVRPDLIPYPIAYEVYC